MQKIQKSKSGFTIIEVLIVLAVAGVVLVIVFLAIPALQRMARNNARKRAVGLALAVVLQYPVDHGGVYPFAVNGIPDPGVWDDFYNGYIKGTELEQYTFNILPLNTTDFSYVGPLDELTFSTGHSCNTDPASDNSIVGDGVATRDVVVWTKIEGSDKVFCLDNATHQAP